MESPKQFIEAMHSIEYSDHHDVSFFIEVKYVGDGETYRGWSLPKGDYILQDGLRDPGFGDGPVKFHNIEFVRVLAKPLRVTESATEEKYKEKYQVLCQAVRGYSGVNSDGCGVGWLRNA